MITSSVNSVGTQSGRCRPVDYALITLTALVVSGLTLVSGFGLGTVLMPAFAVFFPIPTAIAATAVVLGASALVLFARLPALESCELLGRQHEVTAIKLTIGALIAGFALLELSPAFAALAIPPRYLVVGGLLSGFFGGLSGNQGAFRSAFLIKSGLGKEAFVATGVVSAVIVDSVRLATASRPLRDRLDTALALRHLLEHGEAVRVAESLGDGGTSGERGLLGLRLPHLTAISLSQIFD